MNDAEIYKVGRNKKAAERMFAAKDAALSEWQNKGSYVEVAVAVNVTVELEAIFCRGLEMLGRAPTRIKP